MQFDFHMVRAMTIGFVEHHVDRAYLIALDQA